MYVDTQVRPQGEQQVGKMKLSEAIRQGRDELCKYLPFMKGGACALMSAYELATGSTRQSYGWSEVESFWLDSVTIDIIAQVIFKNSDGESRESIADWLEAQGL